VADAALTEPCPDLAGLGAGFRAQAVVDDQRGDPAAAGAGPALGEQAKRQAVGSARDRDGKTRRALERSERRDQGGERGVVDA